MTAGLALALSITGCRDVDSSLKLPPRAMEPSAVPSVNYVPDYLSLTGFTDVLPYPSRPEAEFGLEFKPTKSGEITSLLLNVPVANTTGIRVTLWNADTKTSIATWLIKAPLAMNVNETVLTAPVALIKNRNYALTMYTGNYLYHNNQATTNATYPITAGPLIFNAFIYQQGNATGATTAAYPNSKQYHFYAGDLGFKFRPVE